MFLTRTSSWLPSGRKERASSESRSVRPSGQPGGQLAAAADLLRLGYSPVEETVLRGTPSFQMTSWGCGSLRKLRYPPSYPHYSFSNSPIPSFHTRGTFRVHIDNLSLLDPHGSNTSSGREQTVLVGAVCPAPLKFRVFRSGCAAVRAPLSATRAERTRSHAHFPPA